MAPTSPASALLARPVPRVKLRGRSASSALLRLTVNTASLPSSVVASLIVSEGLSLSTPVPESSPSVAVPSSLIVPVPVSVVVTAVLVVLALSVKVSAPSYTVSLVVGTDTASVVTPAGTRYTPATGVMV